MLSIEIEKAYQALCTAVEDLIKIMEGGQEDQLENANVKEWQKAWHKVTERLSQVSAEPADIYTCTVGTALWQVELKADELDLDKNIDVKLKAAWRKVETCHMTWMHAHMNADDHDGSEKSIPATSIGGTSANTV